MEFLGNICKKGKYWLIEIPCLDVLTQGTTQKEAFSMGKEAVEELVYSYFGQKIKISVHDLSEGNISISTGNNKLLLALSLKRQREKQGLTIRDVTRKTKKTSPNNYSQYERGEINITFDQYEKFLRAINTNQHCVFGVI